MIFHYNFTKLYNMYKLFLIFINCTNKMRQRGSDNNLYIYILLNEFDKLTLRREEVSLT